MSIFDCRLPLAIGLLILTGVTADALFIGAAPIGCPALANVQTEIANMIAKEGGETAVLGPEESRKYLEALNAEPPKSNIGGGLVLYFSRSNGRVQIGLVMGTQMCPVAGSIAVELHDRLLRIAREHWT